MSYGCSSILIHPLHANSVLYGGFPAKLVLLHSDKKAVGVCCNNMCKWQRFLPFASTLPTNLCQLYEQFPSILISGNPSCVDLSPGGHLGRCHWILARFFQGQILAECGLPEIVKLCLPSAVTSLAKGKICWELNSIGLCFVHLVLWEQNSHLITPPPVAKFSVCSRGKEDLSELTAV